MSQPKVSVIVAVYNAEKTLTRCLDSLKNQTLPEIEFVCVDDGSTDNSPVILDRYAAKDGRFRVFHKANEGVSATRQFGLDHIFGEYVIHLDADDYAEPDGYRHLYELAQVENADIVICDAKRITETGIEYMDYSAPDYSVESLIKRTFSWELSSLSNRLIRTELISRYGLSFPKVMQLSEDRYFITCLLCRSLKRGDTLKLAYLNEAVFYYDNTANPASLTKFNSIRESMAKMTESFRAIVNEVDMTLFGNDFYTFVMNLAFKALWSYGKSDLREEDYQPLFGSFLDGIESYAPSGSRKTLVLLALRKGIPAANRLKWIAIPAILSDKIRPTT